MNKIQFQLQALEIKSFLQQMSLKTLLTQLQMKERFRLKFVNCRELLDHVGRLDPALHTIQLQEDARSLFMEDAKEMGITLLYSKTVTMYVK